MQVKALFDLDCFYAQVEHRRLNIPKSTPLYVEQMGCVIASNYAARDRDDFLSNFSRSGIQALKDNPEVHVEHVLVLEQDGVSKCSLKRYRQARYVECC